MRRPWMLLIACLAVLAAACGDDDTAGDTATDGTTTTSSTEATGGAGGGGDADGGADGDVPQRIVSLSPTSTEVLFAIGAGDQVVAVDERSDHPADAPVTDLSGFEPSLEAIASYDPDLVVTSGYDPGDLVPGLEAIGVQVLSHGPAASLQEAYDQIEELGEVTGHEDEAAEVVADMQDRIEAAAAEVADDGGTEPITVYHEVDETFFSASSASFIGELYGLLGLENIADEADTGSGFPQLNAEYIIEADPDLIVITDEGGYSPEDVAARPGWDAITAVAEGDVLQVDADLPSRWGPRVAEFVELVADHVAEMQAA